MKAAVTGAAGFIGSQLAARLIADGHDVRVIDIVEPDRGYIERSAPWAAAAERSVLDLRRPGAPFGGADWVFHFAANHGGVGYLHDHGPEAYTDNTRMSLNVLDACEHAGVERVLYASSACAYPVTRQRAGTAEVLKEWTLGTGDPDGLYGLEKFATLRLCEALRATGRLDVRVGIFNTVYGPGQTITGERTKFPPAIVAKALECRRTGQPLELWGDGSQIRQNIHIDDAVDKILTVMTEPYDGPVNVTGTETVSCDDVAALALKLLGVEAPVVHVPGPTGPMARICSNAMWERVYGPDAQPSFAERFASFVDWTRRL